MQKTDLADVCVCVCVCVIFVMMSRYYRPGECYLKHQRYPQNRKAYERGPGVFWTSGIVAPRAAPANQAFTAKSFTSAQEAIDRDIIHVSGKPKTWYFDDIPLVSPGFNPSQSGVMRAQVQQCGNYNLLPGVASYVHSLTSFPSPPSLSLSLPFAVKSEERSGKMVGK